MLITLDNMANRYSMLPSECLARANTLDLEVLDLSVKFSAYQQTDKYKQNKGYTDKQLLEKFNKVKSHGEQNKT